MRWRSPLMHSIILCCAIHVKVACAYSNSTRVIALAARPARRGVALRVAHNAQWRVMEQQPPTISAAITAEIARRGTIQARVAAEMGIDPSKLNRWITDG